MVRKEGTRRGKYGKYKHARKKYTKKEKWEVATKGELGLNRGMYGLGFPM